MDLNLNEVEIRVLGSLFEKSLATPEYYPLSLNALVNACNQKSSRDPVVDYDEATVQTAADGLCQKQLVSKSSLGRVAKYEELFSKNRQLVPKEISILCVLMLRGPQTAGELRTRTARMYSFDSLEDVTNALDNLIAYQMARQLPRQPGRKESRYAHLLSTEDLESEEPRMPEENNSDDMSKRLEELEQAVSSLTDRFNDLAQEFSEFKKQFD